MNSQVVKLRELLVPVPEQPSSLPRRIKQQQTRLTAKDLMAFSAAYRTDINIRDLAEKFKIHRATVFELVERLGLPHRTPVLTAEEVEEAGRMYRAGRVAA
jgi:hypothetical protein